MHESAMPASRQSISFQKRRRSLILDTWPYKRKGGLTDTDRVLLADIFGKVDSVFEWGLGESTLIAHHMGVPRYTGVDSDPQYVASTRGNLLTICSNHSQSHERNLASRYRFLFADIGTTEKWGRPEEEALGKNVLNYQLMGLMSEIRPFQAYIVDGRYRLPCLLVAFLHANQVGNFKTFYSTDTEEETEDTQPFVLVHDCSRKRYHKADHLLQYKKAHNSRFCIYRRRKETTDRELVDLWKLYARDSG